jgi:hypothetical protein
VCGLRLGVLPLSECVTLHFIMGCLTPAFSDQRLPTVKVTDYDGYRDEGKQMKITCKSIWTHCHVTCNSFSMLRDCSTGCISSVPFHCLSTEHST